MDEFEELTRLWVRSKEQEVEAIKKRREIEDKMVALIGIKESLEGVDTTESSGYIIKVTGRITRKVDAKLVQELAAENGLSDHLSYLLKWTPTIDMKAWMNSSEEITGPLLDAVTSKPSRPSFKITKEI